MADPNALTPRTVDGETLVNLLLRQQELATENEQLRCSLSKLSNQTFKVCSTFHNSSSQENKLSLRAEKQENLRRLHQAKENLQERKHEDEVHHSTDTLQPRQALETRLFADSPSTTTPRLFAESFKESDQLAIMMTEMRSALQATVSLQEEIEIGNAKLVSEQRLSSDLAFELRGVKERNHALGVESVRLRRDLELSTQRMDDVRAQRQLIEEELQEARQTYQESTQLLSRVRFECMAV
jgi:hypothetical protein